MRPYDRLKYLLNDGQKEDLWVAFSRVPCICFGSVVYNRPDLGLQQFEERDLNEALERLDKSFKLTKESAHKDKNWRNFKPQYLKANSLWRNRYKYVIFTGKFSFFFYLKSFFLLRKKNIHQFPFSVKVFQSAQNF